MAYNLELAEQVRQQVRQKPGYAEKKMFGGLCFLLQGNMACGIIGDSLIVRVGPDNYAAALHQPGVREFDITGRSMRGWVMVAPAGYAEPDALRGWVAQGAVFAASLPPK